MINHIQQRKGSNSTVESTQLKALRPSQFMSLSMRGFQRMKYTCTIYNMVYEYLCSHISFKKVIAKKRSLIQSSEHSHAFFSTWKWMGGLLQTFSFSHSSPSHALSLSLSLSVTHPPPRTHTHTGIILGTRHHRSYDLLSEKLIGHFPKTIGHKFTGVHTMSMKFPKQTLHFLIGL